MKCIALFVFAVSAMMHVALAQDNQPPKQPPRSNRVAAPRPQPRNADQPRQLPSRPQFQRPPTSAGLSSGPLVNSNLRNDGRRNNSVIPPAINVPQIPPVTAPNTPRTANVQPQPRISAPNTSPVISRPTVQQGDADTGSIRNGSEDRRRRNDGNWSGNDNESGRSRNGHSDGDGNRHWRDGDGNNNWSDRSDSWRRRHGHWDRCDHNRNWYLSNFARFAFFGGGYYYLNSGYWYPAYGYDPYFSTYSYDAPIYAYNDQAPGQVIANVQAELERRGYDTGGVDGTYGPTTRRALLRYQSDNGLPVTGEIDQETLDALGLQ